MIHKEELKQVDILLGNGKIMSWSRKVLKGAALKTEEVIVSLLTGRNKVHIHQTF